MYLRNLMAMDTEEMVRAQPMDAVVLLGGCDKTLPAQIMGAASAGIPAIVVPVGPMVVGHHRGEVLGACTDCRRLWGQHRSGTIDAAEIEVISGPPGPFGRHLHGNGHRLHHGLHHRGDGLVAALQRRHPRPPTPSGYAVARRPARQPSPWPPRMARRRR